MSSPDDDDDNVGGDTGGILVTVEPLQSSFFAGEPFSAKVTFTNTRPASISTAHASSSSMMITKSGLAVPPRPASASGASTTFKHKRGAHSITYGSVPLANPPTSPGIIYQAFSSSTPSLSGSLGAASRHGQASLARKGLIGLDKGKGRQRSGSLVQDADDPPFGELTPRMLATMSPEQKRRYASRRTISVDMSSLQPAKKGAGGPPDGRIMSPTVPNAQRPHPPSPLSRHYPDSVGTTRPGSASPPSTFPSSLSRSPSLVIARSHPHARKQSVIDATILSESIPQSTVPVSSSWNSSSSPSSSQTSPVTPAASSVISPSPSSAVAPLSTFASALDPITESPNLASSSIFEQPNGNTTPMHSGNISYSQPSIYAPSPLPSQVHDLQSPRRSSIPIHPSNLGPRKPSISQTGYPLGFGSPPSGFHSVRPSRSHSQSHPLAQSALTQPVHHSAFSSMFSPPNTEVLLWSYAQLLGIVEVDETTPGIASREAVGTLRAKLNTLKGGVVGGGRMDIGSVSPAVSPNGLTAGSWSRRSIIPSFLGGSTTAGAQPSSPGGSTLGLGLTSLSSAIWGSSPAPSPKSPLVLTPTGTGEGLSSSASGVSGGLSPLALPTLETQPSMLAVDLNLAPGESRTYIYMVELPDVLPPTFRGKAIKFSYHLVIGTSRAVKFPVVPPPPPGQPITGTMSPANVANQRSRIMRFPIRVYNNVLVGRPQRPYDLCWPLARRRIGMVKCSAEEEQASAKSPKHFPDGKLGLALGPKRIIPRGNRSQFEAFAKQLVELAREQESTANENECDDDGASTIRGKSSARINGFGNHSSSLSRPRRNLEEDPLADGLEGCRASVDILTRVSKKASYDINKDGVKVAVLTFAKSAYRLGETILAVVEMNAESRAKVLKFSAMLEAHESLPSPLRAVGGKSRGLRRIHAEYHTSLAIDTLRSPFTLDIPSDASPGFHMGVEDDSNHHGNSMGGGLEWKVRLCFLVAMGGDEGTKHLVRDGKGGDWAGSLKATSSLAPLARSGSRDSSGAVYYQPSGSSSSATSSAWSLFSALTVGSGAMDPDEREELEWSETVSETVECEVGITVWPGNTLYKPTPSEFEV